MQWFRTNCSINTQILSNRRLFSSSVRIPSRAELITRASTNGTIVVNPSVKKNEKKIIPNPTFLDIVDDNSSATQVFSTINQVVSDSNIEEKGVLFYGTYAFVTKMNTDLKNLCTQHVENRLKAKKLKVPTFALLTEYWLQRKRVNFL